MSATINGRAFDVTRIDTTVQFGSVEEWLLTNTSPLDHPMHLHRHLHLHVWRNDGNYQRTVAIS